ncbi:UNVERIFIED_CONTAM: hypothetical protein Cloal_1255 [Acetivibrio alkalicellulosi]
MYNAFLGNLSQKLINDLDYVPVNEILNEPHDMVFKKISINKIQYIRLYCDSKLNQEELTKSFFNSIIDEKADDYTMYMFVFLKKPPQDLLEQINSDFLKLRERRNITSVVICLEEERILLDLGIVFPNHIIIEAVKDSLKNFKSIENHVDINNILEEKNKKPESTITINQEDNLLDDISYKTLLFSLFAWGSLKAIDAWTGIFEGILSYSQIFAIVAIALAAKISGDNYGERKLIILTFIGGVSSFIFVNSFWFLFDRYQVISYNPIPILLIAFVSQSLGGLLYMRFRIKNFFTLYKNLKYIFVLIGLFIIICMFSLKIIIPIVTIMFVGTLFSFLLSGVLGFENEHKDYILKKKMGTALILLFILSTILFLFSRIK